jgi:hypothetical protein
MKRKIRWLVNLKQNYGTIPIGHKTARRRGVVWGFIRLIAKHNKRFTWHNISPPLTREQAMTNLKEMAKTGELKIMFKGLQGRPKPTVYSKSK